jgi:hypothetical protein
MRRAIGGPLKETGIVQQFPKEMVRMFSSEAVCFEELRTALGVDRSQAGLCF